MRADCRALGGTRGQQPHDRVGPRLVAIRKRDAQRDPRLRVRAQGRGHYRQPAAPYCSIL